MTNPLRIANEKPRIGRLPSFVTAAIASAVDFAKKVAGVFKSPSVTSASSVPDSGPNDINQLNPPIPPMRPPTRNKALIVETTFLILVCLLLTGGVWKARSQTRPDVLREETSDKSLQPESSTTQVVSVNSSEGKKVGSDLNEVNEEVNGEGKDWNDETSETDEVTTLRKKATTKQLTYEESPKLKIDDYKKDISDSDGMRNSLNTTEETLENNDKNDNEKDVEKVEVETLENKEEIFVLQKRGNSYEESMKVVQKKSEEIPKNASSKESPKKVQSKSEEPLVSRITKGSGSKDSAPSDDSEPTCIAPPVVNKSTAKEPDTTAKKPLSSVEVKELRQKKANLKIEKAELDQERNEIIKEIDQINNKIMMLNDIKYKSLLEGKKEEWMAKREEVEDEMAKSNLRGNEQQFNMRKLRTQMDNVDQELSKYVAVTPEVYEAAEGKKDNDEKDVGAAEGKKDNDEKVVEAAEGKKGNDEKDVKKRNKIVTGLRQKEAKLNQERKEIQEDIKYIENQLISTDKMEINCDGDAEWTGILKTKDHFESELRKRLFKLTKHEKNIRKVSTELSKYVTEP